MKISITTLLLNITSGQMGIYLSIIISITLTVGIIAGVFVRKFYLKKQEEKSLDNIKQKEKEAQKLIQTTKADAKVEIAKLKKDLYAEIDFRKEQNLDYEKILNKRERKLTEREEIIETQTQNLYHQREIIKNVKLDYHHKIDQIIVELEKNSGMSKHEAKEELFKKLEERLSLDFNKMIKNHEYNTKLQAKELANNIISEAIERYASNFVVDKSVAYVKLPNDEMKGRIIGKEGRNIKLFELTAGVDIIIDDTPETIQISSFNPIRREIATRALEDLVKDGRIHPIRIEEVLKFHEQELNENFKIDGKKIIDELKLTNFEPELVNYIGRLKYRTSYGQNVLLHSYEVAKLAGSMAAELGLDINLAKRAGLLHDIGKAVDYELEGSHVYNGVILAKKYGEDDIIINAIHSHHGDVPKNNIYSCLVSAADTLSAARPGARNNSLEEFITRIKEIEDLCKTIKGVDKAYAVQAGRQIRVIVDPNVINDIDAHTLARTLKEKLQRIITIPGDIHITVIREVRATELIS
ncbi:ribonuclease Y [Spiroplasma sp. AdecLV25b]|uniref:ribonuclease Y n=1 Tax=Spiroplasma sp. AdecLV25b TaxID=3027162 RepID=UPI0027E0F450|nr:ribonuclease Y [Spiroplasma sp. AdecLV25b]